jgi:hypothetical protein
MAPGNSVRLSKLVDREFRELTGEPERTPTAAEVQGSED